MILSFRLAVRFLRSGRLQTVLIIGGISIAIAVQLFVGLLIGSLQKGFVDRTLGSSADVTVESAVRGAPLSQDRDSLVTAIRQVDGVEVISVVASGNGFVEGNIAARLRGFVLEDVDQIYNLSDSLVQGNMPSAPGEVIIGEDLREELQIEVGDTIMVTMLEGAEAPVVVSGIYDLGVAQINESWVISDLETIQGIFGFGEAITAVEVGVDDVFRADAIAESIAVQLGDPDISISNWKDDNEELFQALRSQDLSSFMIQAAVIASVVVAIASMLAVTVLQKSRQIGILKAMGIKDRSASLIFLFQGFLLGLVGSVIGVGIGLVMLYGFVNFASDESGSPLIEFYLDWRFILLSWAIAIVAATLAGVLPARRSARLSPIEVINAG
jgi:lipoprotein-releasing system permease protein